MIRGLGDRIKGYNTWKSAVKQAFSAKGKDKIRESIIIDI